MSKLWALCEPETGEVVVALKDKKIVNEIKKNFLRFSKLTPINYKPKLNYLLKTPSTTHGYFEAAYLAEFAIKNDYSHNLEIFKAPTKN